MYGVGTLLLYGACFLPLPRWALVLVLLVSLTLLEYITGLIFIKGMHIKLWDYSKQWGNVQGIICPALLPLVGRRRGGIRIFFVRAAARGGGLGGGNVLDDLFDRRVLRDLFCRPVHQL